jgi:hypothetical protein
MDDTSASDRPAGTHEADHEPSETDRHGKATPGQRRSRAGVEDRHHDQDEQGRED